MIPYFFAHDLQNYARLMPEYLAQMYELKEKDNQIWEFFNKGNFSVNKSELPFNAIGADHGIEQENRTPKVIGGVTGILINKMALHRFGLVAPELNRICDEFLSLNDISNFNRTRHYQLTGSMNLRIICNVNKLCSMMEILDVTFADSQSVYNIVSKAVLSEQAESDMITHVAIGTEMYKTFLNERVTGERSIWEKMKKRKMLTFKSLRP